MPIFVRDETANAPILTINNDGTMCFGDGTPISMLTLAGYGIIDSNGHITHGLGTQSGVPVSGTVNCGIHQTINITTLAGRIPNIQLDTQYPASNYFISFQDPNNPQNGGSESVTPQYARTEHMTGPFGGGFSIINMNTGDGNVDNPNSEYYDPNLNFAPCIYRWI